MPKGKPVVRRPSRHEERPDARMQDEQAAGEAASDEVAPACRPGHPAQVATWPPSSRMTWSPMAMVDGRLDTASTSAPRRRAAGATAAAPWPRRGRSRRHRGRAAPGHPRWPWRRRPAAPDRPTGASPGTNQRRRPFRHRGEVTVERRQLDSPVQAGQVPGAEQDVAGQRDGQQTRHLGHVGAAGRHQERGPVGDRLAVPPQQPGGGHEAEVPAPGSSYPTRPDRRSP